MAVVLKGLLINLWRKKVGVASLGDTINEMSERTSVDMYRASFGRSTSGGAECPRRYLLYHANKQMKRRYQAYYNVDMKWKWADGRRRRCSGALTLSTTFITLRVSKGAMTRTSVQTVL